MKKLIFILFIFCSYISFGQGQDLEINTAKLSGLMYGTKSGGIDSLISHHPDSLGQFKYKNMADPVDLLDGVNLRTLYTIGGDDSTRYESDGYLRIYAGGITKDSTLIDETTISMNKVDGLVHLGTLDEHFAHVAPPYVSYGGEITDNGDGTITVAQSESYLKISNAVDAEYKSVLVPESTLTVTPDLNMIVYVDYNGGSPGYRIRQSTGGYFYSNWDEIPIAPVINIGSKIIVNSFSLATTNGVYKNTLGQLNYEAIRYLGGFLTSEIGTRQLSVSAGAVLKGNDYEGSPSFNTSTGDTFTRMYYTTGSGWTRTTGQTTVSNSQYNDIATGLATLTATPERWANKWLFRVEDSPYFWILIEGQTAYTSLAAAESGQLPSILPPEVSNFYAGALLVAKIIVSGNETNFVDIQNPFTTKFTSTAAASHENLSDLYLANTGVTYGHINDQTQSIYGGKTFADSVYARTMPLTDSSTNVATTEFVRLQNTDLQDSIEAWIGGKSDTINTVTRDTIFIVDNGVIVADSLTGGVTETNVIIYDNDSLVAENISGDNYGDQQLTTTGAAGQIAITGPDGNSITLNVNDGDYVFGNEWQDLGYTASPTNGVVGISNGTNATIPLANTTNAGLMPPNVTVWNYDVQALSGTTDTLNVDDGMNATLTISGNSTVLLQNLEAGMTGNITITCNSSGYTFEFVGYTKKVSPFLESTSGVITTTATTGAIDVYSWWYDGTRIIINGTKNYD